MGGIANANVHTRPSGNVPYATARYPQLCRANRHANLCDFDLPEHQKIIPSNTLPQQLLGPPRGTLSAMSDATPPTDVSVKPPRRRLRIATSVFVGVVCVALIVLWAMSYKWLVICQGSIPGKHACVVQSLHGSMAIYFTQVKLPWTIARTSDDTLPSTSKASRVGLHFTFKVRNNPGMLTIQMPIWFALLVAGFVAALPWLPISNRFSLRTLLIAMTLVALMLGLFVSSLR